MIYRYSWVAKIISTPVLAVLLYLRPTCISSNLIIPMLLTEANLANNNIKYLAKFLPLYRIYI